MSLLNLYEKPGYKMNLCQRIKWWFRREKYIRQRARWGFSEYDVWDFDVYHAELVSNALSYLADHNISHPYDITDEDWKILLEKIAKCFKQWNEDSPQPAYEAYCAAVKRTENEDGGITVEAPEELLEAWREEEKRNYENKLKKLKEGFDLLFKYYPNLWD